MCVSGDLRVKGPRRQVFLPKDPECKYDDGDVRDFDQLLRPEPRLPLFLCNPKVEVGGERWRVPGSKNHETVFWSQKSFKNDRQG